MNIIFYMLSIFLRKADAQNTAPQLPRGSPAGNYDSPIPRENLFTDEPPDLIELLIVVARVFNILVFSVGVVLVAMIFLSAYKFSISQGDPKGIEGAKKTLSHALLGFLIVVGVYALLSLIVSSLGGYGVYRTPGGLFEQIRIAIVSLNDALGITN